MTVTWLLAFCFLPLIARYILNTPPWWNQLFLIPWLCSSLQSFLCLSPVPSYRSETELVLLNSMNLLCVPSSLYHYLQMPWNASPPTLSFCLTTLHGRLYSKQTSPQEIPLLPILFLINFSEVLSILLSHCHHWNDVFTHVFSRLYFSLYRIPDLYPAFSSS